MMTDTQKQFSILLCCYGDYPQYSLMAINSILAEPEVQATYEIHVGLNQCGQETTARMRELLDEGRIDTLLEARANLNKDPMMRLLLERTRTPYLVWMDDDSYFLPGGVAEMAQFLATAAPFDIAGHIFYVERKADYMTGYEEFLRGRPWFRTVELIEDQARVFFATGGLWAARADYLREHNFPDRAMLKRQDDLLLADLVIQTGSRLTSFPETLLDQLKINQAPRRGIGEAPEDFYALAAHREPTPTAAVRKLRLHCALSPGDILMLTAAVRDLHLTHPGKFLTDVRTTCSALWENNPYITQLEESDAEVEEIQCEYPLIHQSNQLPYHFIHGFRMFLQDKLGVAIQPHAFKGDVHLSAAEKSWMSQVEEIEGLGARFWIIVNGGKWDYTAKWWDPDRMQQVVDHFRGRISFVQCGEADHCHPQLTGVLDLVGKTDLRQMVRLMYHADGVICPVTMFMHLAAAVETKPGRPKNRPCVVIAGGREPVQWEAYPHHQFLHTNGALPCCENGGCWKSRVEPLGDGDEKDQSLCLRPITLLSGRSLPQCLDLIRAPDVVQAVERYLLFETQPMAQLQANGRPRASNVLWCPHCSNPLGLEERFCG